MISQIAAMTVKVAPSTPCPAKGEMEARPRPTPKMPRMVDIAAAVTPPATTAPQDTPLLEVCAAVSTAAGAAKPGPIASPGNI